MQDEISNKIVVMVIRLGAKGLRLTEDIFRKALQNMQSEMQKLAVKADRAMDGPETPSGKQTMKQLMEQNTGITNVKITDQNIRSFDRTARKYSIDYSLMKDKKADVPTYYVFFKAKDMDVMKAAMAEYTGKEITDLFKPEVEKVAEKTMECVAQIPEKVGEVLGELERGRR